MQTVATGHQYELVTNPQPESREVRPRVDLDADKRHVCIERKSSVLQAWLVAWYLPPAHLACSVLFWYFMVGVLQERHSSIGTRSGLHVVVNHRWYQSDITTIISVFLLLIRTLAGLSQAIATWRSVFFLLEMASISLPELEFLVSWKLPAPGNVRLHRRSSAVWFVVAILLLAWPAQFIAPLASGAVAWIPDHAFDLTSTASLAPTIGEASYGAPWNWYLIFPGTVAGWMEEFAAVSSFESYLTKDNTTVPSARRPTWAFRNLLNGTSIENATLPLFETSSFEWVSKSDVSEEIYQAVSNSTSGFLNRTGPESPLLGTSQVGVAALLKTTQWSSDFLDDTSLPTPQVFNGEKYAALFLKRYSNTNYSIDCSVGPSDTFQPIPSIELFHFNWDNGQTDCYAVARMHVVAGTVACADKRHDGSLCALSSPSLSVESHLRHSMPEPDPLVIEVFNMIPEVIPLLVGISGFGQVRKFSKSLLDPELYLQNILKLAYHGTWSSFSDAMTAGTPLSTNYIRPTSVVRASVSSIRMHGWLAVNLLLTLSSLLVAYLQYKSTRPVVNNHILKLLLLDNSELLDQDRTGLCNATALSSEHDSLMRLILRKPQSDDGKYHHDVLKLVPKRADTMKSPLHVD